MRQVSPPSDQYELAALMALAHAGGPQAALAARRAAWLAERRDPALSQEALTLALRLEPLDPAPRLALARLAAERGAYGEACTHADAVLLEGVDQAARVRAAFMLGDIARVQADFVRARMRYQEALRIEEVLLASDRTDPTAARWYARARGRIAELDAAEGERARALVGAEGALAMLRACAAAVGEPPVLAADIADAEMRLGALELDEDQPASARRRLGEAIGRYEALAVTDKDEPHWRAALSDAWALAAEADYARGAPEQAREAMDKALQARLRLAARDSEEAWALAGTWRLRGALRAALGDSDAAAESHVQARALAEQLAARAPRADSPARFLVHTLLDQADHALRSGALDLAREAADTARTRAEAFARADDAAPAWLSDIAACWDRLGEAARCGQAQGQAQDAFARAVEFRRKALQSAPEDKRLARGLAAALVKQGDAALAVASNAVARAALQESVDIRVKLANDAPEDSRAARALAAALERLGLAAAAQADPNAARAAWELELSLVARIFTNPGDIEALRFRAIVESHLAGAGGAHAETYRRDALARLDTLARAGVLTEREAALRKRLWGG